MATYYRSGDFEEAFGKGKTRRLDENGKEFQLFIHVVDLLNEGCFKSLLALSPGCPSPVPFIRRFGKGGSFYLKAEEREIDGFPDLFIVRDDIVCIIDHFRVDSSDRRNDRRNSGTEFMAILGEHGGERNSAEAAAKSGGTVFSPENLAHAIRSMLEQKASKLPRYTRIVRQYIKGSPSREVAEEDGAKPVELWLLIEDVSPQEHQFTEAGVAAIVDELDGYPGIAGVLYVNCGYEDKLPRGISDIRLAVQDSLAIIVD